MAVYTVTVLLVTWGCALTGAQQPSPCPKVFRYEPRPEGVIGRWTGVISLSNEEDLNGVFVHVGLDSKAYLFINWFGESTSKDNTEFTVRKPDFELKSGKVVDFKFEVTYNAADIPPSLLKIRLNGKTICAGIRVPRPVSTTVKIETSPTTPKIVETTITEATTTRPTQTTIKARRRTTTTFSPFFIGDLNLYANRPPTRGGVDLTNTIQCGTVAKKGKPLITYGTPSVEGNWPWHVAIYVLGGKEPRYICGGSLITKAHVVTAAHCVTIQGTRNPADADKFVIHLGRTNIQNLSDGTQERRIDEIRVHPRYNYTYFHDDVAVVRLVEDVHLTDFVRPVCLWDGGVKRNVIGKLGVVVGWGYDEHHAITDTLRETRMPVVDPLTCIYSNPDFFNKFTSRTSFCAGYRNGTSVCNGDSGGGMFFQKDENNTDSAWELRGLVSVSLVYQREYCDPYNYVVFTDLAHHTDWINEQVEETA